MKKTITFITGNQHKADYLRAFLGYPVEHCKLDLEELQSLDLRVIVEHKVKQAYAHVQKPVLVEDVALEFDALHGLPGPFIKFFVEKIPESQLCDLIPKGESRSAIAKCIFGYYDGEILEFFEGRLNGTIALAPSGDGGYGWDRIFIPDGYQVPRAALSEEDDKITYLALKPFQSLKQFLEEN